MSYSCSTSVGDPRLADFIACTGVVGMLVFTFKPVMASTVLGLVLADFLPLPSCTGVLGVIVTMGGLNLITGTVEDLRGPICSELRLAPTKETRELLLDALGVKKPLVLGMSKMDGTAVLRVRGVAMARSWGQTLLSSPAPCRSPSKAHELQIRALKRALYFLLVRNTKGFTVLLSIEIQAQARIQFVGTLPSCLRSRIFTTVNGVHKMVNKATIMNRVLIACKVLRL